MTWSQKIKNTESKNKKHKRVAVRWECRGLTWKRNNNNNNNK